MEVDIVLAGDAPDFLEGLDGSDFVVGMHDGNQHGLRTNGALHVLRINHPACAHAHIGHTDATFFKGLRRVENGVVFDARGDDVRGRRAGCLDNPKDRSVIRFCAAAREDHLAGPGIEQLGNLLASLLYRVLGPLAVPMDGRGVAEVLEQVRLHRLKHFRRQRRRRVVVQIYPSHNGYFPWRRLSFRAKRGICLYPRHPSHAGWINPNISG